MFSSLMPEMELRFLSSCRRETSGQTATFYSQLSFQQCGLEETMVEHLGKLGIRKPSHVQATALQTLQSTSSRHAVIADHAGSGKTLAYLMPIIQSLRAHEQASGQRASSGGKPFAIIVLPTTELCQQVHGVVRAIISAGIKFSSIPITGGFKKISQRDRLREGTDIVVATPGRLFEFLQDGELSLEKCQFVVLDEVDVLASNVSLFAEQIAPLREAATDSTRFIMVTASLPELTWMDLQAQFPGAELCLGPGLHRPAPGTLEQLVDCSGGEEINEETGFQQKFTGLMNAMLNKPVDRTLIFCNKLETCRKVENGLKRAQSLQNLTILPHHQAIDPEIRVKTLASFLGSDASQKSAPMVLISTDRASRGIDTTGVGHVILFDFPRDPSEYVRRAGRTARGAGGQGTVTLLVLGRQVQLAKQILDKNEKGLPIHKVPAPAL